MSRSREVRAKEVERDLTVGVKNSLSVGNNASSLAGSHVSSAGKSVAL